MIPSKHFIIAGAQRSGSTFLAQTLAGHPDIAMAQPWVPEPKYFLPGKAAYSKEDYLRRFFAPSFTAQCLGEKTVSYFETPASAALIHTCLPEAKLIFILRDPVLRAVSNYFFSFRNGFETRPLEEVFSTFRDRLPDEACRSLSASPYAYLARGEYARMLEPFDRVFGFQKIFILIQENWLKEGMPFGPLLDFLGVPDCPELQEKILWKTDVEAQTLSPFLKNHLSTYYRDWNARLAKRYSLDLGLWT